VGVSKCPQPGRLSVPREVSPGTCVLAARCVRVLAIAAVGWVVYKYFIAPKWILQLDSGLEIRRHMWVWDAWHTYKGARFDWQPTIFLGLPALISALFMWAKLAPALERVTTNACGHGDDARAFVCQHIATTLSTRIPVGFHWSTEDTSLYPDAWCAACARRYERCGQDWVGEAADSLGIKCVCGSCYMDARTLCLGW
jgi:hypothetical protein